MDSKSPDSRPNILIVDDNPANLRLLTSMLRDHGYTPRPVPSGELALKAARMASPDLILLDITMPEMDGFTVCKRLQEDPVLKAVPVLFISALTDATIKVKAFTSGGCDYITKPFQFEEVEARVRMQLELQRQRRALQASYERLQKLEKLRDDLTHMIVHDMRGQLTATMMSLDLTPCTKDSCRPYIEKARNGASKLAEMMTLMLDISRLEAEEMPICRERCELLKLAKDVVEGFSSLAGPRTVVLSGDRDVVSECDRELVRRVIQNLLSNAFKFTPAGGTVEVRVSRGEQEALVQIRDTGVGISEDEQTAIFEKFQQAASGVKSRQGSGLGLAFCKLVIEAHGGQIGVNSKVGAGSTFWFSLP